MHEILANGRDVQQYRNICEELRTLAPTDPDAQYNRSWAEQTERTNEHELHRLNSELKGYKNNLVKESIRVRHYLNAARARKLTCRLLTLNRWATRTWPSFLKVPAK